jgi:H+/Cl- antiporter ClcA
MYSWVAFFMIGFTLGCISFLMDLLVDALSTWKYNATQTTIDNKGLAIGWIAYTGFSIFFVLIAALLTIYVGPAAIGSGVAELIGILNGVDYPGIIGIRTLIVKILGVCLGVAAGLCIGKEGPLAHIGAIVGTAIIYLPLPFMRYLRNDVDKRKFMAGGIAAGVSAAFGAPIGGTLFAYEISKPNTFWTFSLTWRVFFSSSISTFFLNIWKTW